MDDIMSEFSHNPFLTRLMNEKLLARGMEYAAVADKDPVVPGHILIFSTRAADSVASAGVKEFLNFLATISPTLVIGPHLFIERGRSSSCTCSGVKHAHAHLVPCAESTWENEKLSNAYTWDDFQNAYSAIPATLPYIAYGILGKWINIKTSANGFPRHLTRTIISMALSNKTPNVP